ncbi:MBL fold metallo-hydrolase [Pseudarthrobacter sulfonivorans]|uniref:MBL fold metallo-hydrolase n=1 Tax=Pseudarthrobacter sulfonivorans TaxID=121292 RepID=UPI002786D2FD|nr:MBL fold metallo-hydrolase [Pseudarthrobacter sulfonivorans]MDP9998459.1 glyoxylase-like metal-dependent hydrolase (beta-lactamase superfamily II) [Pseudarthrobacter sulfonivorans]
MQTEGLVITGTAQRTAWVNNVHPPVEHVAAGVLSVPVVFPRHPMRYTLSYILSDDSQCVVVDPGFDSDQGHRQLVKALASLGIGPNEVTGVIATHHHIDHLGMARRVADQAGAWIALGTDERRYISAYEDEQSEVRLDQNRMRAWGVPEVTVPEVAITARGLRRMRNLPDPDYRLADGQGLQVAGRDIRIMATPGHTPGHICLWDDAAELVLSGDHVLPRITPNVSLAIRGETDPLRRNLDSLRRVALNDHYEVCPAHEYRFRGLAQRAEELERHSQERTGEVHSALESGAASVYETARKLTWSRGWESLQHISLRLALSETAAHIQYLVTSGAHGGVPGLPPGQGDFST